MKQFLVMHKLGDEGFLSEDLVPRTLTVFRAMKPFLLYLEATTSQ